MSLSPASSDDSAHAGATLGRGILRGVHFRRRSRSRELDGAGAGPAMTNSEGSGDTSGSDTSASTSNHPAASKAGDPTAQTEGRPDALVQSDGQEVVAEWKEGRDLVIETRRAPGEDVEVVVIRGGAAGEPGEVEQRIQRLKQRFMGRPPVAHN